MKTKPTVWRKSPDGMRRARIEPFMVLWYRVYRQRAVMTERSIHWKHTMPAYASTYEQADIILEEWRVNAHFADFDMPVFVAWVRKLWRIA